MSIAIGIDLGTTNSVAAFKFATLEVVTAPDNAPPDHMLTRSAVVYGAQGARVGQEAIAQLVAAPERVVVSIKRLIGRGFADPAVKSYLERFKHLTIETPSGGTDQSLAIRIGAEQHAPEDVSAEILRKVTANAQAYLASIGRAGAALDRAVITVPAYFNDKQRHATRVAGTRAGFRTVELLPEPTAAAISFAHNAGDAQTILVYDFGGGTFDASLITAAENSFIESAKAGDLWLGGNDVDLELEAHVLGVVAREEGIPDIQAAIERLPEGHRRKFRGDLQVSIEQAKIALSNAERTMVSPATPLLDEHGMQIMIEVPLTRADLEARIAPLVERTIRICQEMIADSGFPLDTIDRVLLVGGSSQIPLVQRKMREAFGDRVVVHARPMTAVAEGAAVVAAGLVEKIGTVSRDYFIRLIDDPRFCVIPRNEVLPVRKWHDFATQADGQRLIHMRFFNLDHVANVEEPIGDMWLGLDKPYPKGTVVSAGFELDESCDVLRITASLKNDPSIKVSRTFSRGQADEAIYKELDGLLLQLGDGRFSKYGIEQGLEQAVTVINHANQVVDTDTSRERPEAVTRSKESLSEFKAFVSKEIGDAQMYHDVIGQALKFCDDLIPAGQRERLEGLNRRLATAIDARDEVALKTLNAEAKRATDELPPPVHLVLAGLEAFRVVSISDPVQAGALSSTVDRLIGAVKSGDGNEALRLFEQLRTAAQRSSPSTESPIAKSLGKA